MRRMLPPRPLFLLRSRRIRRELFNDFKETAVGMMENIQETEESRERLLKYLGEQMHETGEQLERFMEQKAREAREALRQAGVLRKEQ